MSISDDLYLVLAGYDGEARTAILQLKVNPLVNFVWLGTFFLMIGFSIAVWPERREQKAKATVRGMAPAMVGATTLALAMLTLVLAFI
jgi:cytochrome c biogenesis factor